MDEAKGMIEEAKEKVKWYLRMLRHLLNNRGVI